MFEVFGNGASARRDKPAKWTGLTRAEEMSEAQSAVADESAHPFMICVTRLLLRRSFELVRQRSYRVLSVLKRSPGWIAVTARSMLLVRVDSIDSAQSGRTLLLGRWIPPHTDGLETLPA